jgi:3-phenylpropionate/trans-cinnamate dioxygenase ferredoxin subunit
VYNYKTFDTSELEFIPVATINELGNGERIIFDIGGETIAVFNIAGKYFAIADVCSHDDGPVAEGQLHDHQIECPRHGARFDLETGKALSLPAVIDIPAYPVRIEGNDILIGLPKED